MKCIAKLSLTTITVCCLLVGVAGQYINLAQEYRSDVKQSSTYVPDDKAYTGDAENAVDGNTDQTVANGHCSHTTHDDLAWWWIGFTGKVHIDRIIIYHRNELESSLERFIGSRIYTSDERKACRNNLVYTQTSNPTATYPWQDVFNISVGASGVSLSVCQSKGFVQLCEVLIMGCPYDKYGNQCNLTCGQCDQATCSLSDGTCPGWCKGQYMGPKCDKPCSVCKYSDCNKDGCRYGCVDGKHGDYCDLPCPTNCKDGTCGQYTGHCSGCTVGHWGDDCQQNCSVNCNSAACGQSDGQCTDGCKLGYYKSKCDGRCGHCVNGSCQQDTGVCDGNCLGGYWGSNCNNSCPENCGDQTCSKNTGTCDGECRRGYWGVYCNKTCSISCKESVCIKDTGACVSCPIGRWGQQCNTTCPAHCVESTCDISNGSCVNGCTDGYRGNNCAEECIDGYYGTNCTGQCGNCADGNQTCHHTNGTCLLGCTRPFIGHLCLGTAPDTAEQTNGAGVGAAVGGSLAGVMVLAIAAIVVSNICNIRRNDDVIEQCTSTQVLRMRHFLVIFTAVSGHDTPGVHLELRSADTLPDKDNHAHGVLYANTAVPSKEEENYYNISSSPRGILVGDLKQYIATHSSDDYVNVFEAILSGPQYPQKIGQLEENVPKNRYRTTFPYDHSRVHLKTGKDTDSDYINASYIDYMGEWNILRKVYVFAGPKTNTVQDTWAMIVHEKCGKIVMLTNLKEGIKTKCERYWPLAGEVMDLGNITLTLASEEVRSFYTIRNITVTSAKKKKNSMAVQQFHFTAWPDHGVADPRQLVVFHRRVMQSNTPLPGPLLVHCSAGIGRTGTFIGLDALLAYGRVNKRIDIPGYVAKMRRGRVNMVQTAAQLQLLHEALYEALMYPGSSIPRTDFVRRHEQLHKQISTEYQLLQTMLPTCAPRDCSDAKLAENQTKNRTDAVLPLNKHRAILTISGSKEGNYINAVVVSGSVQNTNFLVTQLPLPDTTVDFWRLVYDYDSNVAVLLNPLHGKENYPAMLPTKDSAKECGGLQINLQSSKTISNSIMELIVVVEKNGKEKHEVKILYTTSWRPEKEFPPSKELILDLNEYVTTWQLQKGVKPITVQCL
ncbi:hypothetical protein ScPMuIL_001876 [Solemya velum]